MSILGFLKIVSHASEGFLLLLVLAPFAPWAVTLVAVIMMAVAVRGSLVEEPLKLVPKVFREEATVLVRKGRARALVEDSGQVLHERMKAAKGLKGVLGEWVTRTSSLGAEKLAPRADAARGLDRRLGALDRLLLDVPVVYLG